MEERRRHTRVGTPVLIEFPNPDTMTTERSFTEDVSESGMRFPTTVRLQVGHELPLTLSVPFHDASSHVMGQVIWVREISRLGTPQYDIGVRFAWLDDPDRQRLVRHLSSLFPRRL